tara:strand:- start:56863 stop:58656 length:1794 start_codon:yes stop_codon:yes gene_type:complete
LINDIVYCRVVLLSLTFFAASFALTMVGCAKRPGSNDADRTEDVQDHPSEIVDSDFSETAEVSDELAAEKTRAAEPVADNVATVRQSVSGPAVMSEKAVDDLHPDPASDELLDPDSPMAAQADESSDSLPRSQLSLPGEPVRLYLPTSVGPLLVDVHICLDGHHQAEAFYEQIDKVIADAKKKTEDRLSWSQLFQFVQEHPSRFGPVMRNVGNQAEQLIRRYDTNRNRSVEHDELEKFLFRQSTEHVAFRLRGTDYFQATARDRVDLLRLLDSSGTNRIRIDNDDEIALALHRLDSSSDQQVGLSEVVSGMADDGEVWGRRRTGRHGDVAMDLEGFVDWMMVSYSIDADLQSSPFSPPQRPIVVLDENRDGEISAEECNRLSTMPPHFHLMVDFLSGDSPRLGLVARHPLITDPLSIDDNDSGQLVLADDRFQLVVQVVDRLERSNSIAKKMVEMFSASTAPIWAYQVRARSFEQPDLLFAWLDRDQNQVLSAREIAYATDRLRASFNNRSEIQRADLPVTYTLKLVRGDPAQDTLNFQQMPSSGTLETIPRWATEMDINGDREISKVEFIGTIEQFDELDANADGFLGPIELRRAP